MVLFDRHGQIKRYTTPEEILLEFFELRMEYYVKRRAFLIQVNCWANHPWNVRQPPPLPAGDGIGGRRVS